ncbi:hypothetical protein [Streptomyces sp. NPDC049949]|uniref:hypothetical protein n=1 Tax=Streptomyces sp. NPDC049949 TaxID=3154627 RepID=UPI003430911E
METACAQGWEARGLGLDCDQCRLHGFIPLHATSGSAVCPACFASALYQRENNKKAVEVVHRLNAFIDRAVDDGLLPHLLVAHRKNVVTRLAAVSKALDRAGFKIVAS